MFEIINYPKCTFVTGGISSGKSLWAEDFVNTSNKSKVYLATAQPIDNELREKIKLHRSRRGSDWRLLEDPYTDGKILSDYGEGDIILFECLSTWLGNLLYKKINLKDHMRNFLENLQGSKASIVIVSVESGSGVIPLNDASRTFVKELGCLNQSIVKVSDLVVLVTAGLPLTLKGHLPQ